MTDEKFCEMYSAFHGDGISHLNQLVQHTFTGEELKEFIEFAIKFRNKDTKMKLTKELYEFIERECKHFEEHTSHDVGVEDILYSFLYRTKETFCFLNDWDEGKNNDPFWNEELNEHSAIVFINKMCDILEVIS